jgi:hypothetical protein
MPIARLPLIHSSHSQSFTEASLLAAVKSYQPQPLLTKTYRPYSSDFDFDMSNSSTLKSMLRHPRILVFHDFVCVLSVRCRAKSWDGLRDDMEKRLSPIKEKLAEPMKEELVPCMSFPQLCLSFR